MATFLEKLDENIVLVIDERYMDFVKKEVAISKENDKILDSIKLLKKDLILLYYDHLIIFIQLKISNCVILLPKRFCN